MSGGSLTLVATPIGNLEDVSQRSARALKEADRILAEDTRRTRALLTHLGITGKRVERLDAEIEARGVDRWIQRLDEGEGLVVVSDAGTPTVSDPGAGLVRAAVEAGHTVVPLPGPSAVMAALSASGFGAARFRFFGFLPRRGSARRRELEKVRDTEEVVVLFESPSRMPTTLADLAAVAAERQLLVAREMTKVHEEFCRGSAAELAARESERAWIGELTLVLGPTRGVLRRLETGELDDRIDALIADGMRVRDVARSLALDSGWSAREVYARVTQRKEDER